ncbi:hypothetical protein BA768_01210 [Chryseobacterium sp. CBo1]|uniref:hypothetical protein n=1 Tax=Chryseobacterium sp. CBo1 TaxID=1869230 RepID=UPI000810A7A7|nr:hypothetical protein [Chryseobacterium sp. CBo1]OCK53203.1 hypothetical protein BA768_01210 [Chryseobacterium sp. CBo1]
MKEANITNPKRISITVYRKIQEDYDLRAAMASDLGMRENALYLAAYRKSKSLENYFYIESFKKHTGWTDDQIFEVDKQEIIDAI